MQDGETIIIDTLVKEVSVTDFGEEKVIGRSCNFSQPFRSPELTTADLFNRKIFKIPNTSIRFIQFIRNKRRYQLRGIMYTSTTVALNRGRNCDSPVIFYLLRWWSCGTHVVVINNLKEFSLLFVYLFFYLYPSVTHAGCFMVNFFFFSFLKKFS